MSGELTVTLVQTELLWEDSKGNLEMLSEKLQSIPKTDLIVLPEMFTTGFTMHPSKLAEDMDGQTLAWMKEQAVSRNAVICGSVIIKEGGLFFNRFIATYPHGEVETYDKKHLFTLAGEDESYSPGVDRKLIEVKGWKWLPLICYDLRFPVWARSQRMKGQPWEYDGLICVANWPKPRIKAWDTLLAARAIENQAFCIGVNRIGVDGNGVEYIGHSAAYDYAGSPALGASETDELRVITLSKSSMNAFREKLPFQRDADGFELM